MPASPPLIVRPEMFTVFAVPTVLFVNAPEALPVISVTVSPLTTPTNAALPVFSGAVFVPS